LDPERQPEMAEFARKADGRRVFTVDFKRETVGRIVSGEKTLAELSRELGISPWLTAALVAGLTPNL
jgi:transposase-like protein